jgi:acyl-CoA thioesterase FadM
MKMRYLDFAKLTDNFDIVHIIEELKASRIELGYYAVDENWHTFKRARFRSMTCTAM